MSLLSEINAHVAENAVEAEHLSVLEVLKKKYKTLQPKDATGKTVARVITRWDSIVTIFDDNTFLYGHFCKDVYDGCDEVLFMDPEMDWVAEEGLMLPEDRESLDRSKAYFANKSQAAEDHRLLHQVRSRFGLEKLRELFG